MIINGKRGRNLDILAILANSAWEVRRKIKSLIEVLERPISLYFGCSNDL